MLKSTEINLIAWFHFHSEETILLEGRQIGESICIEVFNSVLIDVAPHGNGHSS